MELRYKKRSLMWGFLTGCFIVLKNQTELSFFCDNLIFQPGYIPELSPTKDIRELQKKIDLEKGELKRERNQLGEVFAIEYKNKILNNFDFESFLEQLDHIGASRIVLFCVEEFPEACHRSLVTDSLKDKFGHKVTHL